MKMQLVTKKKKGFTLIELIVVIAILGILAAIAIPRLTGFQDSAKKKADVSTAKTLATATTTLIADQRITLPAAATSVVINDTTANTAPAAAVAASASAPYIRSYMQSVPKNKAGNASFCVVIAINGDVSVYAGAVSTEAGDQLYPTPGANYQ